MELLPNSNPKHITERGKVRFVYIADWEEIAGYIKGLITDSDHVNDSPYKLISDINNVLDNAFGDMNSTIKKIK